MASLNAANRDRFTKRLKVRYDRSQNWKRTIEVDPGDTVETVAAELQAPIDELPADDPRRITFDSIKERVGWVTEYADLPMPKIISNPLVPPDTPWWIDTRDATFTVSGPWPDPPVETKVYIDNQEVATVQRESLFGGRAIEFAEDQAVKPRLNKSPIDKWREEFKFKASAGKPVFQFRTFEFDDPKTATQVKIAAASQQSALDAINEAINNSLVEGVGLVDVEFWKRPANLPFTPYCKANCGERTINQSGYCTACLDRMAVVGRVPEPKVKTPLVEMRPKRQIQLED